MWAESALKSRSIPCESPSTDKPDKEKQFVNILKSRHIKLSMVDVVLPRYLLFAC